MKRKEFLKKAFVVFLAGVMVLGVIFTAVLSAVMS